MEVKAESVEMARRKALQIAVAALCVEAGFVSADKDAMGTLSEIIQSCELNECDNSKKSTP